MARVIRSAISDREIMSCLTAKDLTAILTNAVESLTPSDVRGFIYRCMTNREVGKGLIMADRAIDFAVEMARNGDDESWSEIVGAAVGTLSMLSESITSVKEKIDQLLEHTHPSIVVAVIENLGRTSDIRNFNRVSELLLSDDRNIAMAAAKYVEACARDAAFGNRTPVNVIEDAAEEFLRNALLKLECIYEQLKKKDAKTRDIEKRLAILVAMMYNEMLDSADWKRFLEEQVDDRIYYALEHHLAEDIGPVALPYLLTMVMHSGVEKGIKRSALCTLGRLSRNTALRPQITEWLPEFVIRESSEDLVGVATSIQEACSTGKAFSRLSSLPKSLEKSSIVPRTVRSSPKFREE
jgi:hypothetical protein